MLVLTGIEIELFQESLLLLGVCKKVNILHLMLHGLFVTGHTTKLLLVAKFCIYLRLQTAYYGDKGFDSAI